MEEGSRLAQGPDRNDSCTWPEYRGKNGSLTVEMHHTSLHHKREMVLAVIQAVQIGNPSPCVHTQ